jgi:hypothetical protein
MMAGVEDQIGYAPRGDVPKDSPIGDEIASLHSTIDRLEHQVARLYGKLGPVLRSIPENENAPLSAVESGSQFTEELRRARARVGEATEQIIRTLDRLDV